MAEAKKTSTKKKAEEAAVDTSVTTEKPVEAAEEKPVDQKKTTAKAGKRSEKAIKEAEAKVAKEERKAKTKEAAVEAESKTKQPVKPARSKFERRSKNYRSASELIEKGKVYSVQDGLSTIITTSKVKFDASVELHVKLGVDPRQADQNIRQTVTLPAGTGKKVRVAVFADPDAVKAAEKAGADIAGSDEFLQQLDKGTIHFDVLISTPAMMAKLGKYARVLGPKGLMPNPKSGTVTNDVAKAVTEAKAGKVEYRVDSTGIVHVSVGKVSFGAEKLQQNTQAILNSIKAAKPASLKGVYIQAIYLTTTMGPSLPVETNV
jgi:large subunit ribosomal protein L1